MATLETLERQHEDIRSIIDGIKLLTDKSSIEKNASNIATQISLLAGKLKIHLASEDNFMYPLLLKSDNVELRNIAQQFVNEMGDLSSRFVAYKNKFNTKNKILNDIDNFLNRTEEIIEGLTNRLEKEDRVLYPLIKK